MLRLAALGSAALAALAAWLSQGTIGLAGPQGARLAVLPVSILAILIAAAPAIGVVALRRAGASLWPVLLLGLLLLPWLPVPVPAAFLLWVGPLAWGIWIATFVLMAVSLVPRSLHGSLFQPRLTAGILAALLFGLSAWRVAPMLPGGDEPHYLVITQSLLLDGDLTIADVHRRGDYRAYYTGELAPHVQTRGSNGAIYSVHAPGLPVLIAPAFAVGGYPAVVVFLILVAAAGSVMAWHVAWLAVGRRDAAWFGWAAVTLPVTAIFQGITVYPDGVGGVLALTGVWALLRAGEESESGATRAAPWLLHGGALALLPWFHTRFAVLAGGFGALILLRLAATKSPAAKAVALLSLPALSAVLWVGFFVAVYGRADPTAPYGAGEIGSFSFVPGGLGGLLFDQRFGLIVYAPVMAVAFAGLALMLSRTGARRLALEILFVVVPYLLTVTHFAMWWGGWSAPARFFAPVLPLFAVPAAVAWVRLSGRTGRAIASVLLAITAAATAVVVWIDRGRLAYNTREAPALWLEWTGRLADLTTAAPLWARDTDVPLFRAVGIWLVVGVLLVAGVHAAVQGAAGRGRLRRRGATAGAVIAALAVAAMVGASAVWAVAGVSGRRTEDSQLRLLERAASMPRLLALQLDGWSAMSPSDLPGRIRLDLTRQPTARGGGRENPPMFVVPSLPAGTYLLRVQASDTRGWVMIGLARDQFAIRTLPLPVDGLAMTFRSPVRGLIVRGDEDARRGVRGLTIEPLRLLPAGERLTDSVARRAVRYGEATVFFLDDRSYPEPEAFWIGGERDSNVLYQPDAPRGSVPLLVRNGPMTNQVTLESGTWRQSLTMTAGEERRLEMPLDQARGGGLLRVVSGAGFRPSAHDQTSRDHRYLGVWVRFDG